ncbi:MAG: hypothetical protein HYV34_01090 [Candidatus Kerfeldbacteria bacterium]|nr:hypothetical protein [Candidatus Kerfeldbacteria bacterium]
MTTPTHVQRVGHRGSAGHEPENTLRSFENAIALGCDAAECDVRLTRDRVPVVIHDATVNSATGGNGEIRGMTLANLRTFRIGDQHIPTLAEVLACVKGRMRIILELKEKRITRDVLRVVTQADMLGDTVFSSFAHQDLWTIRVKNRHAQIGLLFSRLTRSFFRVPFIVGKAKVFGAREVHVDYHIISPELIQRAHDARVRVFAWTVNEPEDIEKLKIMGIDGIMSDYPERI